MKYRIANMCTWNGKIRIALTLYNQGIGGGGRGGVSGVIMSFVKGAGAGH